MGNEQLSPLEKAQEVYKCEHLDREYRHKMCNDGRFSYYHQCLLCGDKGPMIKKMTIPEHIVNSMSEIDEDTIKAHSEKISAYYESLMYAQTESIKTDYHAYLETDEWSAKRLKVLIRDEYLCRACLENRATVVHHLTYAHIYNEPLYDLVAVCKQCHELIHNN